MAQIPPAGTVLAIVLAAWASGTAFFAGLTRLGREVQNGHFKVVWLVTVVLAALASIWHLPMLAVTATAALSFASIYLGGARAAAGVAAAVAVGAPLISTGLPSRALLVAGAGAALLGAVTNAMLLGHWHLNQPRLSTGPLTWLVRGLWAAIAVFAGACGLLLSAGLDAAQTGTAVVGAVTGLAFVVFTAILTAMVTHLVSTRSIMSATGILYLAILLCFVAVFTGALGALSLA